MEPGGLETAELQEAFDLLRKHFGVHAAALTAYDPSYDPDGLMPQALIVVQARLVDTETVGESR